MKWFSAVIRQSRLDDVVDALDAIGISRMTVTEVQGCGGQTRHAHAEEREEYPEYRPKFVPHVQIEVALPDEHLREVIDTVRRFARTGRIGDGKIIVSALESAVRIRTGNKGPGSNIARRSRLATPPTAPLRSPAN